MSDIPRGIFLLPSELLARAIMRFGATNSVEAVHAVAVSLNERNLYIIRVLESSADIRAEVKAEAIANVAADPDSDSIEGQKQLVCILAGFEALTGGEKTEFIRFFKANSITAVHVPPKVVLENTWEPGNIPPQYPP